MYVTKFEMEGFSARWIQLPPRDIVEFVRREQPDVICMDVLMQGMDGFTATKLLKQDPRTRYIPLFFLTNLGLKEDIEKGLALGADEYLVAAATMPDDVVAVARRLILQAKESSLPRSR